MAQRVELACPACSWMTTCGPSESLTWLARAKMARRDAAPEPELVGELFRAAAPRLICPECSHAGLLWREAEDDEADDEAWGMARNAPSADGRSPASGWRRFPTRGCASPASRATSEATPAMPRSTARGAAT